MGTTMPWGETITVLMELGFPVNPFTLDDETLGALDGEGYLDGTILGDDVSPYCQNISIGRGRTDPFATMPAGQATITLFDTNRRFDPTNEDSPYWDPTDNRSGVQPRRKVTIKSGSTTIFVGTILDIDLSYQHGNNSDLSQTTISVIDDFSLLGQAATEDAQTPVEELSSARLQYLLDLPEVAWSGSTSIETGVISLGAYPIDAGTNALDYASQIAVAEQGFFFIDREGTLTFTKKTTNTFPAGVVAEFSDDSGSDIKFSSLSVSYGQENFYNKVIASREGGSPQTADDADSQTEFGIKTLDLNNLLVDADSTALSIAEGIRDRYGEPTYRFDALGLIVSAQDSATRLTLAELDLADIIKIERNYQTGSPAQIVKYQQIERMNRVITPSNHRLELTLSDAALVYELILDDAEFGLMDSTNALV
jgi:hypothetical protein